MTFFSEYDILDSLYLNKKGPFGSELSVMLRFLYNLFSNTLCYQKKLWSYTAHHVTMGTMDSVGESSGLYYILSLFPATDTESKTETKICLNI